jgi:hypothetical protein
MKSAPQGQRAVTRKTAMARLRHEWDSAYMLAIIDDKYTARARFGERDLLEADTPGELLCVIRRHYPGSTSADLCST